MVVLKISKVFIFLILWLSFASCASNSPNTSELIQVTGSDELQNDQDIYIAWSQGIVGSGNSMMITGLVEPEFQIMIMELEVLA